ncbi:hypothetical protein IJG04_03025 [Candidatus Saccharibacteria bacterium]|nr:hypothetical protein [Candidatus Saccharibacteria bacterium]
MAKSNNVLPMQMEMDFGMDDLLDKTYRPSRGMAHIIHNPVIITYNVMTK